MRRPFRRGRGRGGKTPRLCCDSRPAIGVEHSLKHSPELRDQPWECYRVQEGAKGPRAWEVKHTLITVEDETGLPGMRLLLAS